MKYLRYFLFVLFFFIDVTVRASTAVSPLNSSLGLLKAPVEEPRNCMKSFEICSVGTYKGSKYRLTVATTTVTLGSETSITLLELGRFQLLAGDIWVRAVDEATVESEYGHIIISKGEALISRAEKGLVVRNLKGEVTVFNKGRESLVVERGFENLLGPIGGNGQGKTSIPQLIDLSLVIRTLAKLHSGTAREFRSLAGELFSDWPSVVDRASQFHSEYAHRSIASDLEAAEITKRRRQAQEAERRRLDKLFRARTLDNY